ncbi:MAG TPA: enoyl-CoA hydratase [Rhodospirillaceae bacterium]|nr:enoyl-CoA hydratase [Rhodospirillaceae bacterium]
MSDDLVLTEIKNRVGILTFNRPKVLHAIDIPMLDAIESALDKLESDPEVRVIIITGSGDKAFMAGGDIPDLNSRRALDHYWKFAGQVHHAFRRFEESDKPNIAAINGYAFGGGMELLLSTDMRLMADTARIGLTEIVLGLFPGGGGSQRLPRQISKCRANELMFTGEHITADEAYRLGLINRVVPKGDLMSEAMALAEKIADKSPMVLAFLKRAIQNGLDMPLPSALAHERAMISLVFDTEDAHEGCSAFSEKRKAVFKGQ